MSEAPEAIAAPEIAAEHEAIEEEQLDNRLLTSEKVVLLLGV